MKKQIYFLSLIVLCFLITSCKNEVDDFISKFKPATTINVDEIKNIKFEDLIELDTASVNKFLMPTIDTSLAYATKIRYFAQFNFNLKTEFNLMTLVANFEKFQTIDTVVFLFTTDKDFKLISSCAIKGQVNNKHHLINKLKDISFDKTSGKFDFAEIIIDDYSYSGEFLTFFLNGTATMQIQKNGQITQKEYIAAKDPMGMEEADDEQLAYLLSLFSMKEYPVNVGKIQRVSEVAIDMGIFGFEGDESQYFPSFRLPSTDKFHILVMDYKTDEFREEHTSLFTLSTKGNIIDNKKLDWTDDGGGDWASTTAIFDKNLEFVVMEILYDDDQKRTDTTTTRYTFNDEGKIIKKE